MTLGSPSFRAVRAGGFRVTEAAFPPHAVLPLHAHEHTVFSVILSGGFLLRFERTAHDCSAGTAFVEPSGERHGDTLGDAGARVLIVEIERELGTERIGPCSRLFGQPRTFVDGRVAAVAQRLASAVRAPGPAALSVESLILDIIALAAERVDSPRPPRPGRWLDRVRDKLHGSVNAPLRVTDLAREVGVHRVHLGRAFQARFGMCLGDYHRQLRVQWAALQLAAHDAPVGSIAIQAGFADHAHFTRVFKRSMGLTPQAYRRESRRRGRRG